MNAIVPLAALAKSILETVRTPNAWSWTEARKVVTHFLEVESDKKNHSACESQGFSAPEMYHSSWRAALSQENISFTLYFVPQTHFRFKKR